MEQMSSKEKEERLLKLKTVHAQRLAAKRRSSNEEEDSMNSEAESEETNYEESDTTRPLNFGPLTRREESSGEEETESELENKTTPGTKELSIPKQPSAAVSKQDRSMDLKEHLRNLREASSHSMNLLDSTNQHLSDLMNELKDNYKERNVERADPYRNKEVITQTVSLANQLHKNMKLKLDTVKVLHKISTDIGD